MTRLRNFVKMGAFGGNGGLFQRGDVKESTDMSVEEIDEKDEEWEEVDDGNGNTYFYNTITGESQWEKPINKLRNVFKAGMAFA